MAFAMAQSAGHDSADDFDQFIKDEDSSPSPESDKPLLFDRRPSSQFQSAVARKRAGKPTKSISGASSSTGPGSPSSSKVIIPRRAEDWEPWKSVLHELYITQNFILKDVMAIMEDKYNLKAT